MVPRGVQKIGVEYAYFRHAPENNWYPHYIHNLDNLIRFGGLYPPIHVHADIRRTVLLGATWVHEGGCMAVRANDQIFQMIDLKGKRVGISKSLNTIKNDWWRIQEHMGIENMLMLNGMTMKDIDLVEFPYADDWYDKPEMLVPPMNNPLGVVDAAQSQTRPGLPPAGDRVAERQGGRDLHPEQGVPTFAGGDRQDRDDRGPVQARGLESAGGQYSRGHHLHRCDGQGAPRARHRLHEGHDQGRALGQ